MYVRCGIKLKPFINFLWTKILPRPWQQGLDGRIQRWVISRHLLLGYSWLCNRQSWTTNVQPQLFVCFFVVLMQTNAQPQLLAYQIGGQCARQAKNTSLSLVRFCLGLGHMIVRILLLSNRVLLTTGLSVFLSFGDLLKESGGSFDTD